MTAFGNAKLDHRGEVRVADLPEASGRRAPIGFVQ
jgi:ATP-dependent Lon protease